MQNNAPLLVVRKIFFFKCEFVIVFISRPQSKIRHNNAVDDCAAEGGTVVRKGVGRRDLRFHRAFRAGIVRAEIIALDAYHPLAVYVHETLRIVRQVGEHIPGGIVPQQHVIHPQIGRGRNGKQTLVDLRVYVVAENAAFRLALIHAIDHPPKGVARRHILRQGKGAVPLRIKIDINFLQVIQNVVPLAHHGFALRGHFPTIAVKLTQRVIVHVVGRNFGLDNAVLFQQIAVTGKPPAAVHDTHGATVRS